MTMRRLMMAVACVAVLVLGPGAQVRSAAADYDDYGPGNGRPLSGLGILVEAGGGVFGFTRSGLTSVTDVGGDWNARVVLGTRFYIGGEVSYVGSLSRISIGGIDTSASLLGSGLEGALRLQIPLRPFRRSLLVPYILGGVGWQRYDLVNQSGNGTTTLYSGDNELSVPLGAGVLLGYNHFVIDLRGMYHLAYLSNLVRNTSSSAPDNWSANVLLGYEF